LDPFECYGTLLNYTSIQIDVDKDLVTLSVAPKKEDEKPKKGEKKKGSDITWHHTERSRSFVKRSLRLPENADTENISASYNNGVLTLSIPKKELLPSKKKVTIA
jgi:HSP20 family protein